MGTNFVMGPPPYPLEWILRDATAPGGAYHGNYGHETSVIVDYPFVTGPLDARLVPDRAEDGRGARDRPQAVGVPSERRRRRDVSGFPVAPKTGRFAIVEQLLADGITYMFGNPGTVEQGFLDALGEYPEMRYVTTLQETIAVAMADGYARATQKPTLVQLHSRRGPRQRDRDDVPGEARRAPRSS